MRTKNPFMVKYKLVSKKLGIKEIIKSSKRLRYCFTIRSQHRKHFLLQKNSRKELLKRRPLMTTLKHSFNSQPEIYLKGEHREKTPA